MCLVNVIYCSLWLYVFETLKLMLRKNLFVNSIIQEKLKEKESRKTQTFKKDDDKKKKLMQVEVQVGQAFAPSL